MLLLILLIENPSQSITRRDNYLMAHRYVAQRTVIIYLFTCILHKGGTFNYKGGGKYFLNIYFQTKFSLYK